MGYDAPERDVVRRHAFARFDAACADAVRRSRQEFASQGPGFAETRGEPTAVAAAITSREDVAGLLLAAELLPVRLLAPLAVQYVLRMLSEAWLSAHREARSPAAGRIPEHPRWLSSALPARLEAVCETLALAEAAAWLAPRLESFETAEPAVLDQVLLVLAGALGFAASCRSVARGLELLVISSEELAGMRTEPGPRRTPSDLRFALAAVAEMAGTLAGRLGRLEPEGLAHLAEARRGAGPASREAWNAVGANIGRCRQSLERLSQRRLDLELIRDGALRRLERGRADRPEVAAFLADTAAAARGLIPEEDFLVAARSERELRLLAGCG